MFLDIVHLAAALVVGLFAVATQLYVRQSKYCIPVSPPYMRVLGHSVQGYPCSVSVCVGV